MEALPTVFISVFIQHFGERRCIIRFADERKNSNKCPAGEVDDMHGS